MAWGVLAPTALGRLPDLASPRAWLPLLLLLPHTPVTAITSSSCLKEVQRLHQDKHGTDLVEPLTHGDVCDPYARPCGRLVPKRRMTEHMSRQCAEVLDKHRVTAERLQRVAEMQGEVEPSLDKCTVKGFKQLADTGPTNPIVVDIEDANAAFAMCTVPKSGCTRLRSLLHYLTARPKEATEFNFSRTAGHVQPHANLFHYSTVPGSGELSASVPELEIPKWIVGRNPYVRVLSGFLDKLIVPAQQKVHGDYKVFSNAYKQLKRSEDEQFTPDRESFREFLYLLTAADKQTMDPHLRTAVGNCNVGPGGNVGRIAYNYALKLEELSHWLPCFADAMGLNKYVWRGWTRTRLTLRYSEDEDAENDCWYQPNGYTCEEYKQLSIAWPLGMAVPGPFEAHLDVQQTDADVHAKNALSMLQKFYDAELEELVYEYYKEDFTLFGYDRMSFNINITSAVQH